MPKREPVKAVELTDGQREALEHLWFVYGNYGPKHKMDNHYFVQGFLERDRDERGLYKPTPECVAAVDRVLGGDLDVSAERAGSFQDRHRRRREAQEAVEGKLARMRQKNEK